MTHLKVGMVGAGFILDAHAAAVRAIPGLELHAVADSSSARAVDAARRHGFEHRCDSLDDLLKTGCDVIHVLLPPFLHADAARRIAATGTSVFVEKPLALSGADCDELVSLADSKNVRIGVNHNFLFGPGYERLRTVVKSGALGRLDQVNLFWHYGLPQLKNGPFDSWMLSAPANLLFETGPHAAAFLLDLLGTVEVQAAVASHPLQLPTGLRAYRHWQMIGRSGPAAATLSLSAVEGQSDRILRIRGSGGSAQLDFGRDIGWEERSRSSNPIFEAYGVGASVARQIGSNAGKDRMRRIVSALRKDPRSAPFDETMFRSVRAFYETFDSGLDYRHQPAFAADVIRLCEEIGRSAGVGAVTHSPFKASIPIGPEQPNILVVGGTGFIGRRLVAKLVGEGHRVRVLCRNRGSAAVALQGLQVELFQGSHGDPDSVVGALHGIETVYHLAKCDGRNWDDYVANDVEPTRILANAALKAGVRCFVYTGTIDSYASANPRDVITGSTSLDPRIRSRNLYARSKAACEDILGALHVSEGLPLAVFRPGIVIGEGASPLHLGIANFLSETEVEYWGDGRSELPLVLVDDVATALSSAHQNPTVIGGKFLLTAEPVLNAAEYVDAMQASAGIRISRRAKAPWRYWLADLVKEGAKHLIRHRNRRRSTLHDWRCRTQAARYDSSETRSALGWAPVADRALLIEQGVQAAVAETLR